MSGRALAQKATIRISQEYSGGRLVEIDANSLLSKFFGESGKQVSKAFEAIRTMASNTRLLVFVLLDEVESIAGKRENVTNGGDCSDGLRVRPLAAAFGADFLTMSQGHEPAPDGY